MVRKEEEIKHKHFVEDNPDVLLPTNLDIEIGLQDSCEHEDSLNLEKLTN